jgi:hypothetical protein
MRLLRYRIAVALLHLGLNVMPAGRPKSELYSLMDQWSTKVGKTLAGRRS